MSAALESSPGGVDWRQVRLLLANALRVDARAASPGQRGRKMRGRLPLVLSVIIQFGLGLQVALALEGRGLHSNTYAAILFGISGTLALLSIVLEFGDMLWAPADTDILLWRPIAPPTLFAYRAFHVLLYVALLTIPFLVPAAVVAALRPEGFSFPIAVAFVAGGYLSNVFGTLVLLALYAALLRRLPAGRFHAMMFALQIAFVVVLIMGQYSLAPLLEKLDFTTRDAIQARIRFAPVAWFASLPEMAAAGPNRIALGSWVLGCCAVAFAWLASVRVLAAGFQNVVVQVRQEEGDRVGAPPALDRAAARLMTRSPTERAGFEFLLAQLRGDRQFRLRMFMVLLIPTALTVMTWLRGRLSDPFAAPAGTPPDPVALMAGYFLLFILTAETLTLPYSPNWKAGWIFHVAPTRNLDSIQRGVYAALVYAVFLPAILLQVVCLSLAWRNAYHVALGLGPPIAALPLAAAITLLRRPKPPLSVPPVRVARVGIYAEVFMLLAPIVVFFCLHLYLLSSPARLGLLSLCCGSVGFLMLWLLQHRRGHVLSHAFEG